MRISYILTFLSVLLAAFLVWLLSSARPPDTQADRSAAAVRVTKAERQPITAEISALGTIFPREQATVGAKVAGQIQQMPLLKNRSFAAGQVVARLESLDLQAQRGEAAAALNEARVNLQNLNAGAIPQAYAQGERDVRDAQATTDNARAVYESRVTLYEQGAMSRKDLEAARLALTTAENNLKLAQNNQSLRATTINANDRALAEARVKQAEERLANVDAQLSYATILAPFSGVVTDQFQFQGEFAAVGARLFTIADLSEAIVRTSFADTVAAQIKVGDVAAIFPQELAGEKITGVLSLISRSTDPQSRAVEVWANLRNTDGRLRANSAARVVVTTKTAVAAIVVPLSAVTLEAPNTDKGVVMVVDAQSTAHQRNVVVGIRKNDRIEITAGIQEGETIVVEGNYALPDGTKVEVRQ